MQHLHSILHVSVFCMSYIIFYFPTLLQKGIKCPSTAAWMAWIPQDSSND